MSQITTHVLDTASGTPARGVPVTLLTTDGRVLAEAITNDDGRVPDLGPDAVPPGTYRIAFDTASYFRACGVDSFFPSVTIDFLLTDSSQHYHVPLLLSPFAYSTYRGS
ncbi:hydroxyisourate hydrolase [Spelaeicoccus albus]|uniref:5-hydroxyisourate hydrolase n=1 Tax=Spelaeicoccus albus TaxID=1280376 RepID=A0A7Z0AC31_9MICO|nr:hydroxyisourate hydrolase [Spelaeicoccus albus]NYI67350.1 5-hydroxyisourate hydrolase [Spelaeicoccus albus]